MSSSTTVLLAMGPAAITGIVGYAGARLQARTAENQARVEIDRLRLEQADTARHQRQTAYHDFLLLLQGLDAMVVGLFVEPWSKDAFARWLGQFHHHYGCIDLYGTDTVRSAATRVKAVLDDIGNGARQRGADVDAFVEHFAAAYYDNREHLIAAVEETLNMMRQDILPRSDDAGLRTER